MIERVMQEGKAFCRNFDVEIVKLVIYRNFLAENILSSIG